MIKTIDFPKIPNPGFTSYKKILSKACKLIKPSKILEWGPGFSTALMLKETEAEIFSWEHNIRYFNIYKDLFKEESRTHLFFQEAGEHTRPALPLSYIIEPFSHFPEKTFELVFIDGILRRYCAHTAYLLVKENGAVIFHDYHCPEHGNGKFIFPYRFEDPETDTCICSKNEKFIERFKEQFN